MLIKKCVQRRLHSKYTLCAVVVNMEMDFFERSVHSYRMFLQPNLKKKIFKNGYGTSFVMSATIPLLGVHMHIRVWPG